MKAPPGTTKPAERTKARLRSRSIPLPLALTLTLLASCDTGQVPSGAVLSIDPEERVFEVLVGRNAAGRCVFDDENHQDIPLLLALRDAQGAPVQHADLVVYADYTGNTYPGLAVLQLYDDANSNGVIDGNAELVSSADDDVFTTESGRWTGDRHLLLRVNLSCPFAGELRAFAGASSARMRISVRAGQTVLIGGEG